MDHRPLENGDSSTLWAIAGTSQRSMPSSLAPRSGSPTCVLGPPRGARSKQVGLISPPKDQACQAYLLGSCPTRRPNNNRYTPPRGARSKQVGLISLQKDHEYVATCLDLAPRGAPTTTQPRVEQLPCRASSFRKELLAPALRAKADRQHQQ